ncbi:MAG TPA: sigma-70 family RNA polymerase sigma factor [Gemmataceae bacterium]|jgi:RNA polymerase sigma-70 factor (ECF subfamily)|nr:sigma-70 family RNA polymerase sigma factor [Gemmataceae bacterium]
MTALMTRTRLDADAARMVRARRGDVVAFAELVEKHWSSVVGRFVRQLGDRQEAEDLAQEVFLRLYRARRRYRVRAKFSTWLFHVAANVARNAVRSRRRRPCRPLARLCGPQPDDAFSQRYLPDRGADPTRALERAELAGQVRGALAALAGRQRLALELQVEERSYQEIARRLALSPEATKSLLYRARQQLKESLAPVITLREM